MSTHAESLSPTEWLTERISPSTLIVRWKLCVKTALSLITSYLDLTVPSNPISISIDASEVATAGQTHTLNCTVVKIGGLINSPIVSWTTGGVPVGSGVSVVTTTGQLSTTSVLTFNPLRTSDGGNYMCEGSLTSPARGDPLTVSAPRRVDVKSKSIIPNHSYSCLAIYSALQDSCPH